MGVIINAPDPFGDEIDNILANLIEENVQNGRNAPRKSRKPKNRVPVKPVDCFNANAGHGGSRRTRRYENATFLTSLAGVQDFGEVSIHDFVPETMSAFAQVLMEQDNLNAWNDFVNCTEKEQEEFLQGLEQSCDEENGANDQMNDNECDKDKRKIHPAYAAELRFQRIESKFKNLLKKRHFPLGTLAYLEDQITSFFLEWPHSIYTSHFPSAFDRLLVHALCQYLDLQSESFNHEGDRHTKVQNLKNEFCLPTATLTSFLEKRLNFPCY